MATKKKLSSILTTLDGVEDKYHELYTQGDDGRFYLDAEGVEESAKGLKSKVDEKIAENALLKARLAKLEGVDPDEYAKLKNEREDAERRKAEEKGEWEKLKAKLIDQHQKDLAGVKKEVERRDGFIHKIVAENEARRALSAAEAIDPDLALPFVTPFLKVEESNGEFVAVVVDANGEPRIADGSGKRMAVVDRITEMKASPKYQPLFKGTGTSGGGAPAGRGDADAGGNNNPHVKEVVIRSQEDILHYADAIAKGEVRVVSS